MGLSKSDMIGEVATLERFIHMHILMNRLEIHVNIIEVAWGDLITEVVFWKKRYYCSQKEAASAVINGDLGRSNSGHVFFRWLYFSHAKYPIGLVILFQCQYYPEKKKNSKIFQPGISKSKGQRFYSNANIIHGWTNSEIWQARITGSKGQRQNW